MPYASAFLPEHRRFVYCNQACARTCTLRSRTSRPRTERVRAWNSYNGRATWRARNTKVTENKSTCISLGVGLDGPNRASAIGNGTHRTSEMALVGPRATLVLKTLPIISSGVFVLGIKKSTTSTCSKGQKSGLTTPAGHGATQRERRVFLSIPRVHWWASTRLCLRVGPRCIVHV